MATLAEAALSARERRVLDRFVERLDDELGDELQGVWLYGSRARGESTGWDSDVDLLVVMPFEGKGVHQAIEILDRLDARLPVDLLVRTPQELCERLGMNDFFLREVVERGKVLYAAPDA